MALKVGILSLFYGQGGIGGHVRLLADELSRIGLEVRVFTSAVSSPYTKPDYVVPLPIRFWFGWRFLLNAQLNQQVRKTSSHCQLEVLHGNPSASFGSSLSRRLGIPHVATVHGSIRFIRRMVAEHQPPKELAEIPTQYTGSIRQSLSAQTEIWMEEQDFRRSEAVIAVSASVRDFYFSTCGPRSNVFVIPPFIEPAGSHPRIPAAEVIPNYKEGRTYFLHVGPPTVEKGFHYLLETIALLGGELPDFRILLAGQGYDARIERILRRREVARFVQILGWLPQHRLNSIMEGCSGLIVTSLAEGHPRSVGAAMLNGLPAVAFDTLGVRDVIQDQQTGLLVRVGNVQSLALGAAQLARDQGLRANLGDAARRVAESRYSATRLAAETVRVYAEVLPHITADLDNTTANLATS